jgi:uncharacterized protein
MDKSILQIKYLVSICVSAVLCSVMSLSYASVSNIQHQHTMLVEKDQQIILRDGAAVFADIFRPADATQKYPVIFTYGPYCKDQHFINFDPTTYAKSPMKNENMVWETPDPETWVKDGYIVVRIDQLGSCKSPGKVRILSKAFANDLYDVIEWLGTRPWSSGKVGMLGVSYYAASQWIAAEMHPPHLAAIIPWEGFADAYRDAARQGGILSNTFINGWYHHRVLAAQYGKGTINRDVLAKNLEIPDWPKAVAAARLATDPFWINSFLPYLPSLSTIDIPVYSSGNWGGFALHGKGNIDAFQQVSSSHKWLQMHTGNFVKSFYGKEGVADQKQFFDRFLKGADNGMLSIPPIKLAIRYGSGDQYTWRYENEWPLARTQWTPFYLNGKTGSLNVTAQSNISKVEYAEKTASVTFITKPFVENTEITGPIKLKLWVSSTVNDTDLFVVIKKIDSSGKEMLQVNTTHTPGPVTKGWLRASHRKLDPSRSKPYQPYLTHDEILPLVPGEIVPVEIEVWPTSMIFEAGTTLAVVISGTDDPTTDTFFHNDSADRAASSLAPITTIWTGAKYDSHILLPVIPSVL